MAQSRAKAECVSISFAVQESIWLKVLFKDIQYDQFGCRDCFNLHSDNTQVLDLSKEEILSERSRHIDVKYYVIKEHSQLGTVSKQQIGTDFMVPDAFTKPLQTVTLYTFWNAMGVFKKILNISSNERKCLTFNLII